MDDPDRGVLDLGAVDLSGRDQFEDISLVFVRTARALLQSGLDPMAVLSGALNAARYAAIVSKMPDGEWREIMEKEREAYAGEVTRYHALNTRSGRT